MQACAQRLQPHPYAPSWQVPNGSARKRMSNLMVPRCGHASRDHRVCCRSLITIGFALRRARCVRTLSETAHLHSARLMPSGDRDPAPPVHRVRHAETAPRRVLDPDAIPPRQPDAFDPGDLRTQNTLLLETGAKVPAQLMVGHIHRQGQHHDVDRRPKQHGRSDRSNDDRMLREHLPHCRRHEHGNQHGRHCDEGHDRRATELSMRVNRRHGKISPAGPSK